MPVPNPSRSHPRKRGCNWLAFHGPVEAQKGEPARTGLVSPFNYPDADEPMGWSQSPFLGDDARHLDSFLLEDLSERKDVTLALLISFASRSRNSVASRSFCMGICKKIMLRVPLTLPRERQE